MKFYKHKTTGQVYHENDIYFPNDQVKSEYEAFYDYQFEALNKIRTYTGWILFILALQAVLGIICGAIYIL